MRVSTLVALALLVLCWRPQTTEPKLIEPPFVRKWTALAGDNAVVFAVREGVVYYHCGDGVGALDLATGQRKWSCLTNIPVTAAALRGPNIYSLTQTDQKTTLWVIDSASGQARVLAALPSQASHLRADSERIYVLDDAAKLWAYHPNTGAVLWSRELRSAKLRGDSLMQLEVTPDGVYVGFDVQGDFGVSKRDGKVLWNHPAESAGLERPLVLGGDIITQSDNLKRIVMRTGKILWDVGQGYQDGVLAGKVLVVAGEKNLQGRDVTTGKLLWKLPLADAGASYVRMKEDLPVSDGQNVWLDRDPVLAVTRSGGEKWHRSHPFTGGAIYADRDILVTDDDTRLLAYTAGALPPLPTAEPEKQALAEHLAAQYELLDDAERQQLKQLVPYSFPHLLARYIEWAKAWAADPNGKRSYALYVLLTDIRPLLLDTCRKEDTDAIVSAWTSLGAKSEWRSTLESILMAKGDPSGYIPILVKNLRLLPLKDRMESAALTAVSHSSHPEAVAFLLEALRDPKAAPEWRNEAFVHLAGTGGQEGVDAVRAARARPGPRRPWFDRIDLAHLSKRAIEDVRKDSKGRTWMLFHSGVLGNYSDLFVVEKIGSTWKRPLFTGLWTGATFGHKAPKTLRGIPVDTLLIRDWIKIFPDDPTIRKDTDGDGLTDLVEARLGLDPNKQDTDGDGLSDLVDPCPNAAPRPLGDTEKIVAACLEARFFAEDWGVPAILSAPGVKPFELYGYDGTVLWDIPGRKIPLGDLYGGGVNIVSFNSPDLKAKAEQNFIQYDADHTTAHTMIRRYSGGLNGDGIEVTLRKIGDEWFVIDLVMRYVS